MSTPQRQSRYPIAPEISGGPPMSPQGQQQPPFNQQPPLNQQQPFQPPQNTFGAQPFSPVGQPTQMFTPQQPMFPPSNLPPLGPPPTGMPTGTAPPPLGGLAPPPLGGLAPPPLASVSSPPFGNQPTLMQQSNSGIAPPPFGNQPNVMAPSTGLAPPPIAGQPGIAPPPLVPLNSIGGQNFYQQPPPMYNQPYNAQQTFSQPPRQQFPGQQQPIQQQPMQNQQQPMQTNQQQQNQGPQKPQPKINPSAMPSPCAVNLNQRHKYVSTRPDPSNLPPPSYVPCTYIDDGYASPKHLRMTMYTLPNANEMIKTSQLPFAAVIQPFADPQQGEEPVPVVDFGAAGPIRCRRCGAYINPFCTFTDNGRSFICRVCEVSNEVPESYFSPLDAYGRRADAPHRAELSKGTFDIIANTDIFNERPPQPASWLFALDVSFSSLSCGMLPYAISSIQKVLQSLPANSDVRVGFVTFDGTLHFYNIRGKQPQMLVVSDFSEAFLPLAKEALFGTYAECKECIDELLRKIPLMFQNNKSADVAFAATIDCARVALSQTGGKILAFLTTLPSVEPGKMLKRDDPKLAGTEKEKMMFEPISDFYPNLAKKCVADRVSVDLFLFPTTFLDVSTIGSLPNITGGQLYFYSRWKALRDAPKLEADIFRNVTRFTGFDCLMKVRCSRGINPSNYYGKLVLKNDAAQIAAMDADKSVVVDFTYDDSLDEKIEHCIQSAVLYTTRNGERRLRVSTICLAASSSYTNVYRSADLDACVTYLVRYAIWQSTRTTLQSIRSHLTDKCADILSVYRRFCSSNAAPGQLILPDAFKLLPIYALAIQKSTMLRAGSDVAFDERNFYFSHLNSLPTNLLLPYLYPVMFSLNDLKAEVNPKAPIPAMQRLTNETLQSDAAYFLDNGVISYIWLGQNVDPSIIKDLFNTDLPLVTLQTNDLILSPLQNDFSEQVHQLIANVGRVRSQNVSPPWIVKQKEPSEFRFLQLLFEDKVGTTDSESYVDYLCRVHAMIQQKF